MRPKLALNVNTQRNVVLPNWNDHYWDTGGFVKAEACSEVV
jgi:hypothetical protein